MEKTVLTRMKQGDRDAFRSVITEFRQPVWSFVLKTVACQDDARDILQETFIRVWQKRAEYDSERSFINWVLAIAHNLCMDFLRRKGRVIEVQADDDALKSWLESDDDTVRELSNREWVQIVRALAGRLGPLQRTVFTLSCLEGYESDEIVRITGLDATQVKSNLYAAKQTIRKKLEELGYE